MIECNFVFMSCDGGFKWCDDTTSLYPLYGCCFGGLEK